MKSLLPTLLSLAFVSGVAIERPAAAQPRFSAAATPTALSPDITPLRTRLRLQVDPAAPQFEAEVFIDVRVRRPVPAVLLHASQLEALALAVGDLAGSHQRLLVLVPGSEGDLWRLQPADGRPIAAGVHRLSLRYRGPVAATAQGLFAVDFRAKGQPGRMLATQMEPIGARRLLPGFDEPLYRMPYEVEVRAPAGYEVLSNMPRVARVADGDAAWHRFAPTPPMQSYLLAVSVGRFDVLEDAVGGTPLRIFTAPGKAGQGRRAMDATQQLLPWFSNYFGQPYSLPKLDQLAVPGVRSGAMEDWGLISYAEWALLYEPGRTDPASWVRAYGLIAHEISHQWFGNLVSPASWSEIWLNEAFATWMSAKVTHRFQPEWQTPLASRRRLESTLDRDATPATRAIRGGQVSETTVNDVFDGITYEKGGAVVGMVEQFVGAQRFQRGLQAYMKDRAMKPATAGDLWHHIGRASGRPPGAVAAMASKWTDQPGLPLLDVEAACEAGHTVVTLRQTRFSALDPLPAARWPIPVRLAQGETVRTLLLDRDQAQWRWRGCSSGGPVLANAGGLGFYRVRHAPAVQQALVEQFSRLAAVDRLALLADSFALTAAGQRPLAEHVALLGRLSQVQDGARDALVLQAIAQLQRLDSSFDGLPAQASLRAAGRALLGPDLARLGWQPVAGESSDAGQLRARLVQVLALFGEPGVLAEAKQRFAAALANDTQQVPPALRGPLLAAAGSVSGEAEFDALLAALRSATHNTERFALLAGLRSFPDAALMQRLLAESLSGRLPPDVSSRIPALVAGQPGMGRLGYDFTVEHWGALAALAGNDVFGGRQWLLPNAAGWASDRAMAQRLLADQQRLLGEAGAANAERVAAAIEGRHRWRDREGSSLEAALRGLLP